MKRQLNLFALFIIQLYVFSFSMLAYPENSSAYDPLILPTGPDAKMEKLLGNGIKKGVFRNVDPAVTTKAMHSLMQTLVFETVGNANRKEVTEIFRKVEHLFLEGLLMPGGGGE